MSKRIFATLFIALLLIGLVSGCSGGDVIDENSGSDEIFVPIATGGNIGAYFQMGSALCNIWSKNIDDVNSTASTTGASIPNINFLQKGDVKIIFVQGDIAYYAYHGTEMFSDDIYSEIRGLASLYPETIQIVALKDSKMDSLSDLKGKKVAVGTKGSGTEINARQILEAAGMSYDDIDVHYSYFAAVSNQMEEGAIDAAFVTAGYPTVVVENFTDQREIKILSIDDEVSDILIDNCPFYVKASIPKGTYNGITEDVQTVAVMSMLATNTDLDEALAYELLETMYENLDVIKEAHPLGALIKADAGLEGIPIDLHPGAKKYFNK